LEYTTKEDKVPALIYYFTWSRGNTWWTSFFIINEWYNC